MLAEWRSIFNLLALQCFLFYTLLMSNSYHSVLLSAFSPHPDVTLLRLEAPSLTQRIVLGQFVMAKLAGTGWEPFLREPLFVAGRDVKGGGADALGARWLCGA